MSTATTPTGRRLPVDALADQVLLELAQLEALLRALVARAAAGGDRRALARSAGLRIAELRRTAPAAAAAAAVAAYTAAAAAVAELLRSSAPVGTARIAGRAAGLIDQALRTVDGHAREAIRVVTLDDLAERQADAVTAKIAARTARRIPLTVRCEVIVHDNVRTATSAGTTDAAIRAGRPRVVVSSHGSKHNFCKRLEGHEISALAGQPPYHARCSHFVMPTGVSEAEFADALVRAA